VTVLGRSPISGAKFLEDVEEFAGPMVALAHFRPRADAAFVVSCDLPLFDVRIVKLLTRKLESAQRQDSAAVPVLEGFRQPLCALYRSEAFPSLTALAATGKRSMMAWLDALEVIKVHGFELADAGIDRTAMAGANTPEELADILRQPQESD
jgi:molybdopterin-guanine dinucleotide biosynthesis protein A